MARVALVTGGTRGIGAAISVALKQQGRMVVANYAGNDDAAAAFHEETGIRVVQIRRRPLRGVRGGGAADRPRRSGRSRSW